MTNPNNIYGNRVPPSDFEAEQSVLGGIIQYSNLMDDFAELFAPESFYSPAHAEIFSAMLTLYNKRTPIDLITVKDVLDSNDKLEAIGGPVYLAELFDYVGSAANTHHHAKIVLDKAMLRGIIKAGGEMVSKAYAAQDATIALTEAEKSIMQIASGAMQPKSAVVSDILNDFFEELTLKFENKSPLNGIPTGYKALDSLLSGFCRTDLIILAARPGCGKTSLALCMLLNAALNGTPTAFFSLEMGQEQIIQRLISIESGVNLKNLRSAYLDDADWMHIYNAAEKMREGQCPLYVDDSPALSPLELSARARRLKAEHDIGLIVVDYLQLMRVKEERVNSQEQEIAIISGSLKALAKELNVPIIALSQLNRQLEQRALNDRRPKLSDLRYSGAIEQDADVIMFIYREELYSNDISKENIAEVIVAKHRNGPCGAVELFFKKECTRFLNLRQDEEM